MLSTRARNACTREAISSNVPAGGLPKLQLERCRGEGFEARALILFTVYCVMARLACLTYFSLG